MLEEECFESVLRPVVHCVRQKLHGIRIDAQEVTDKDDLQRGCIRESVRKLSIDNQLTLSIFSLTAHIRAIRPMLFVIVTKVAFAEKPNLSKAIR